MSFAFIRKRNKNYIVYLEYLDKDSNKRKQKNMGSFSKKKDATIRLTEVKNDLHKDDLSLPNNHTVRTFLEDFLSKHKHNISITTYNCYRRICNKYIFTILGEYNLQELKPIYLQNYFDDLIGILSPQTLKLHFNILNLAFKKASRLKLINENPLEFVELPRAKKFRNDIYNTEDMIELLRVSRGTEMELYVLLATGLGLRISEILGLTWDNIDFEDNLITIDKISVRNERKVILKSPKTESSERTISAPLEITNSLKKLKKKQLELKLQGKLKNKENLIFFDKNEQPIAQDVVSKKFKKFLQQNNLHHIRFHDLRHSHVTLLINSKIPIKVISERVGHSNINTTLNIYAHTLKEMDNEASDKISQQLFNLG